MVKNRNTAKKVNLSNGIYRYGYCPNPECGYEVHAGDKFCSQCGQALLPEGVPEPADAPMIYFKGLRWGTTDKWVYGAHIYDGHRNYIITDIKSTGHILRGFRAENVEIYAVNPGSVEIVTDELCPICGKPVYKAQWFDIAKRDGRIFPVRTVVELAAGGETYELSGLRGVFEKMYSFEPDEFTLSVMEAVGIFAEDIGAHCLECGATL